MLIKILVARAVIVLGFVGVVAMRPSEYRVARTATIAAPAPAVFAQVNDFHKWDAWNPWAKLDPAMKQAYAGAPAGIGAIYTWAGNSEGGEGRMTPTESRPSDLVRIRLEFLKPFATTSTAEFSFKPEGDHTAVTWSMTGEVNFMAKVVHLFYTDEHGEVFHTYSSYARGLDLLVGAYNYLDLAPKGRDEDGLAFTMAWVRHHDRY